MIWLLYSEKLTWRDIQHLTVETSSMTGLINIDTMENGVRRNGKGISFPILVKPDKNEVLFTVLISVSLSVVQP